MRGYGGLCIQNAAAARRGTPVACTSSSAASSAREPGDVGVLCCRRLADVTGGRQPMAVTLSGCAAPGVGGVVGKSVIVTAAACWHGPVTAVCHQSSTATQYNCRAM